MQTLSQALRRLFTLLQCHSEFGCYNKVPQTEWHINNRNLFLIVLKPGSLRSDYRQGPVRALFWIADSYTWTLPWQEEGQGALWGPFMKTWISFMRAPPSCSNYLPKALLTIPLHWGLEFQYVNGGVRAVHCTQCAIPMLLLFTCAETWNKFEKHMPIFPCLFHIFYCCLLQTLYFSKWIHSLFLELLCLFTFLA